MLLFDSSSRGEQASESANSSFSFRYPSVVVSILHLGAWINISAMESWLVDVKRVRIPRPKFGTVGRCGSYPTEPPKDYIYEEIRAEDLKIRASLSAGTSLAKETEDLRRAIQQKL